MNPGADWAGHGARAKFRAAFRELTAPAGERGEGTGVAGELAETPPGARVVRVALVPSQGELPALDYLLPDSQASAQRGARVVVPLGRRRVTGVIMDTVPLPASGSLREVVALLDPEPVLDDVLLRLCAWISDYYLVPLGDAIATALPGNLRLKVKKIARAESGDPGAARPEEREIWQYLAAAGPTRLATLRARFPDLPVDQLLRRLAARGLARLEEEVRAEPPPARGVLQVIVNPVAPQAVDAALRRRPALRRLYGRLQARGGAPIPAASVANGSPNARAKLRALRDLGLVAFEEVEPPAPTPVPGEAERVDLSTAQAAALARIEEALAAGRFAPFLLYGVTGSGKTEVYLRAIESALQRGRSALVLVPEISLTHQLVDRLRSRFGAAVAVLHSGLGPGERWREWKRLAQGEARVAIGARSAVFAPVRRLGLVVVDEEHDAAYKQEDGVRYQARDVAVVRARFSDCPVVLGSATPSIESFHRARTGRYQWIELGARVEGRPLPEVEIVDLRRRVARSEGGIPITPELAAGLQANLTARGQSLLFLNRRGFANFVQCSLCGETLMCPRCSVALTLHLRQRLLRCHHCDHAARQPAVCPRCGEPALATWGAGTEQVEMALRRLVPGARVGRMDRDTTAPRGAQRELLEAWRARAFDILVGTQMIAKGHDIPGVTFVGVLLADQALNFPDFRAAERTFQLLTQVAGRAGRGEQPGRVIVQTFQPRHYSLQCAAAHDFRTFAELELEQRRAAGYPPYSRLVLVRCEGERAEKAEEVARAFAARAQVEGAVQVLGPAPAPLERVRGRYVWQVLLRARQGAAARRAAAAARAELRDAARRAGVRLVLDVDPHSML